VRLERLVSMESLGLQEDLVSLVQKVLKGLEVEEDRRVIEVKWVSLEERVNRVKRERLGPKDHLECLVLRENLVQLVQWV